MDVTDVGAGGGATVELWTGLSYSTLALTGSATVTEAGTVTIPVEHDKFMRYAYRFRVTNACATESWESWTDIAYLDVNDNASYVWKAGVYAGDWEDAANWVSSIDDPRCAYPNSPSSAVSFANCEEGKPVVVSLHDNTSVGTLVFVKNTDVTLHNATDDTVSFRPGSITTADGLAFTIDGLYVPYNNLQYRKDMHFTVANGAEFETRSETELHADGAILEVTGQSTYRHSDWTISISGTGSKLIVDDSLVRSQNGSIWLSRNSNGKGNVIEVRGKHPRLFTRGVIVGRDSKSDVPPRIVFVVPEGGYDEAPFQWIQEDNGFCSNNGRGQTAEIVVDLASPALSARRSSTVMLADWTNGGGTRIVKDNIDFSKQQKPDRTHFYYTYGADSSTEDDGTAPTGLWATLDGRRAMMVIVR